ncbi:MAG TPA: HAD family hydrolase [Terriglobales bacterium]|nr:HAD family hydrolase [Terriglobales bacterium]
MRARALFFDVGNTLLFPNRKQMLRCLHERQVFPSEDLLREIERRTKREFDSLLEKNSSVDHGFWEMFYSRLLQELNISDDSICADLVGRTRVSANWCEIRPGTREALQLLQAKHRIAVISNADGKIAEVLARCGIADLFESITDSGIIGTEKPHPAIFRAAVESLKVVPEESVYIGDVYSVDYLGATRFGMKAVLFDVAGAYRERGLPRTESLEELEAHLA